MKLAPLMFALLFSGFVCAHAAEPAAAKTAPAAKTEPPSVSRAEVISAGRTFWATVHEGGMSLVTALRDDCYRQFSARPSWGRFDRCVTFDYLASTVIMLADRPTIGQRWQGAVKRLGGTMQQAAARRQQIIGVAPEYEPRPMSDAPECRLRPAWACQLPLGK